ncbi:hypothetical protein BDF14DRAFT_1849976 [Spinellus fusiger]|nr:hypothetical protein BDF14DRAFT_1849976 [Spinellus fusiger]
MATGLPTSIPARVVPDYRQRSQIKDIGIQTEESKSSPESHSTQTDPLPTRVDPCLPEEWPQQQIPALLSLPTPSPAYPTEEELRVDMLEREVADIKAQVNRRVPRQSGSRWIQCAEISVPCLCTRRRSKQNRAPFLLLLSRQCTRAVQPTPSTHKRQPDISSIHFQPRSLNQEHRLFVVFPLLPLCPGVVLFQPQSLSAHSTRSTSTR